MESDNKPAKLSVERTLTEPQRFWLNHYQACEAANQSLAAYAREQGLKLESFYRWKRRLGQLGLIESASPQIRATEPLFRRVRVRSVLDRTDTCRLRFPNGVEVDLERLLTTVSRLPG